MGAGHRNLIVAAAAAFAVLGAPQGSAQESRAESRAQRATKASMQAVDDRPLGAFGSTSIGWDPDRKPRGRERYTVRFARADEEGAAESMKALGDLYWISHEAHDAPFSKVPRHLKAAPGVLYRGWLCDRHGPVPGAVVDVPPLSAGEHRRVLVPLPKELGHPKRRYRGRRLRT